MLEEINVFNLFTIPGYGLMLSIGVLGLILVMFYRFKKYNVPNNSVDRLLIICAISGLMMYLSASFFDDLWHTIANYQQTGEWEWITNGITFSGGLLGAIITYIIAYWFIMPKERHHIVFYFDQIVIGIVLAHAFGRIGCFLGGCCYGPQTDSFLGITFPAGSLTAGEITSIYGANVPVLPTMLFESVFLFILFFVLFFAVKKNQTAIYLISYGVFRFAIEFIRGDSRGASPIPWLSPSQLLSIIMVISGICLFIWGNKLTNWLERKYNSNEVTTPDNSDTIIN